VHPSGSQCHRRSTDSPDETASHLLVPSRAHNEMGVAPLEGSHPDVFALVG
jgi:hypothetical protein